MREHVFSVGIRFPDNDFCDAITSFMECLQHFKHETLTKENIAKLFNEHIYSFYIMQQNRLRYDSSHTKEYLKIKEENVYLNNEVADFIIEHDNWDNSEFFIMKKMRDPRTKEIVVECYAI